MPTSEVKYLGGLRTTAKHLQSGNEIITDAPVDNHGKGEAFSPTDLVATALVQCMMTIIGIYAKNNDVDPGEISADVTKIMASNPRRIEEIEINLTFKGHNLDSKQKKKVENAALNCPVAKSLSSELKQTVRFNFN
ncbi:OsmC family protein [Mangrovivirga cuniculi]|uniref:Osmotically inducible protein OsmC n=1 Tax=Mangrovivirga cuniculi TaxID=2715131 RepID=A0A4D7JQQ4_9BACT|nr:OsmC family protein [Mangrovivirga cuniculi]QCK16987.1 osmotically inducible protein OsmC [Mangrovivirga cuniculi]